MSENQIQWSEKYPVRKEEAGHTPIQYGRSDFPVFRTYVRCECHVWLGGKGSRGGINRWRMHKDYELAKLRGESWENPYPMVD